jgi:hypothetical protein
MKKREREEKEVTLTKMPVGMCFRKQVVLVLFKCCPPELIVESKRRKEEKMELH